MLGECTTCTVVVVVVVVVVVKYRGDIACERRALEIDKDDGRDRVIDDSHVPHRESALQRVSSGGSPED